MNVLYILTNEKLSENYKPIWVWFWLVYKFTENYFRSWLLSEFIQTQKRYPTCLDKVRILKTTCHIKLKFFLWTKLLGNLLLGKYLVSVAVPLTLISVPDGYIAGVAYEIYYAKYYFWVLLVVRLLIGHSIFDQKRRKLHIFLKDIK